VKYSVSYFITFITIRHYVKLECCDAIIDILTGARYFSLFSRGNHSALGSLVYRHMHIAQAAAAGLGRISKTRVKMRSINIHLYATV